MIMAAILPKAPYVRSRESAATVMIDVIIALCALYFMAFYFYGLRALTLGLVSGLAASLADWFCQLLRGKSPYLRDISALVTGLIIPLTMSAAVPYYVVIAASVFAVVFVKHVFGGVGQSAFNPAAAGIAFAIACWPDKIFAYPAPFAKPEVFGEVTVSLSSGPAWSIFQGGVPSIDVLDLLLGKFAGPMGLTNILVLGACMFYLLFRNAVHWESLLGFYAPMVVFTMLFPRIEVNGPTALVLEAITGMWVFGGIFMLSEPGTLPKRSVSRFVYGLAAAVFTLLFRAFGRVEQTFVFALLLTNVFGVTIDRYSERLMRRLRRVYHDARAKRSEEESAARS